MGNTPISSKFLKKGVFLEMLTIYFLGTMSTGEKNPSNAFAYFWPIKLNTLKTSLCFEATTNVQVLIEYTDFMINANENTI